MKSQKSMKNDAPAQATITFPPATPESVVQLVRLFEAHSKDLRFPDVDAASLVKALEDAQERRASVKEAAESLSAACEELAEIELSLLERARRGHAYASIYAVDSPEIMDELEEIKLGAPLRALRKRRPIVSSEGRAESHELAAESESKTVAAKSGATNNGTEVANLAAE